ncbi:Pvc16 family protein [Caproicibacter sp.]|uniref:Pvc16 family protein n=1 Tax=Caproicibacter sp. TaxID=2814884 RepID=UPI003988B08F
MAGYGIIADISKYLLDTVRNSVCPNLIQSREQVSLGPPNNENQTALLCVYLYGIQDHYDYFPRDAASLMQSSSRKTAKALSLQYILFFSRHAQVPLDALTGHRVFGRLIQQFSVGPTIDIAGIHAEADSGDLPVEIAFSKFDDHRRQELWNSLSEPLRPAIYLEIGPVLLSGELESLNRVGEFSGKVGEI